MGAREDRGQAWNIDPPRGRGHEEQRSHGACARISTFMEDPGLGRSEAIVRTVEVEWGL